MDFEVNKQAPTPMFYVAGENVSDDEAYVEAVMSVIQSGESIGDIRRRQFEDADSNTLNAIVSNLGKTQSTNAQWASESAVASYAALSAYEKTRSDVDVINKEIADRAIMQNFKKNPQAAYNYLSENVDKYEDVTIYDNRYYKTMQEVSKVLDVEGFKTSLLTRVVRDVGINVLGGKFLKSAKPLTKVAGKVLSSSGMGPATDVAMLGSSIQELKEEARIRFIATQTASDEEFQQALDDFTDFIKNTNSLYHAEILEAIEEGPSLYDDAGGLFTGRALQMYGATPARLLKGTSNVIKKNTPDDIPASEKLVQTPSRALVPYKEQLPDVLDSDGVADVIERRKTGTALVPYRDNPVVAVNEGRPILALEDNTKTVTYLPTGEKITYLNAPEERLTLPKTSTKLIEDLNEGDIFWKHTREWMPETRRIRYTDDNNGRGYTYEQAKLRVAEDQERILSLQRTRKLKYVSGYNDILDMYYLDAINNPPHWNVTSAAASVPFTRGGAIEGILGKGEGSQHYGPTGPYSSLETINEGDYTRLDTDPASRGHYSKGLDSSLVLDIFKQVKEDVKPNVKLSGEHFESVLQGVENSILYTLAELKTNHTTGLLDISDIFKQRLQAAKDNKRLLTDAPDVYDAEVAILNSGLRKLKSNPSSVINTWNVRQWDPKKTVDQRKQDSGYKNVMLGQTPQVQKGLIKTSEDLVKMLKNANIEELEDKPINDYSSIRREAFRKIMPIESYDLDTKYLDANNLHVLSDQYPWWYRLAFERMSEEEIAKFGYNINSSYINRKKVDLEGLKDRIVYLGQTMFADTLYKNGIEMAVQSDTNMVTFKNTKRLYTNVQKQEYNVNGVHHQRILDSGSVMRYDTDLQAFVIDTYVSTGGGKGRRPIIVHKEKLSTMDPRRNPKMKKDSND